MIGFKMADHLSCIVLLLFYGIYLSQAKSRRLHAGIYITLFVFLFYLCYSLYISYNTWSAIMLDFVLQIRPYLAFFMVMQMAPSFSAPQKALLKRLCLYMWLFFIPIGYYGFINPSVFNTAMEQPVNHMASMVCLAIVYLYCGRFTVKERWMFTLMLATGLISVYTRFLGFFFLTAGILAYFYDFKVFKYNVRTRLALVFIFLTILYISKSQISHYLFGIPEGECEFMVRVSLYQTAVDILKDFFPLGSGFASFATHASGLYYSQLYAEYGLSTVDGLTPHNWFSVAGAYYPSLAQFGILGIGFYLLFWIYIVTKSLIRLKRKAEIQLFVISLILYGFIFIENISDSFFSSNKGFFVMMFFGLLLSDQRTFVPDQKTGDSEREDGGENKLIDDEELLSYEPLLDEI